MAKRQNFIVGSTNAVTQSMTDSELNHGFDQYEILTADELDGVFNSVSDYSNDSSNEIANAIQSITGAQPTGATQNELAGALQLMRSEIETKSLTFKGYVATSAPSSSTYTLIEGNIWINSATMPTSFPIAASSIKEWNGSSWVNYGSTYTPADFDFFRNINDNEGYYWFGGVWTIMSTDMSTTYFTLNQSTGKWEIKSSVNLPGAPTTTTPDSADNSTKIATTQFVREFDKRYVTNCITEIPQDILVEINGSNGLTLKSGSKVYVPNGSGVYTPIQMSADVSRSDFSAFGSGTYMVFYSQSYGGLIANGINRCVSGATDPSTDSSHVWYDTTENKIKVYDNGSYTRTDLSLPICIMTNTYGTGVVSIDEIFNGFGYIGVTIFRTGIDYLIPNGFNSDGTLKNTTVSTTSCATYTVSSPTVNHRYSIAGASNGSIALFYTNIEYNEKENLNYAGGSQTAWADLGFVIFTGSPARITSFNPKQTFHAVDYYDFKYGNNTFFGNNTFSGTNTFTGLTRSESGSPKFEYKNTGMNIATSLGTSLGDTYIADARDTNNEQSGYIFNRMLTGTVSMKMGAASKTTGSVKSASVAPTVENSGKRYIEATTPTKSDNTMDLSSNTNTIATTEWVKSYAMGLPDWDNQTTLTNGTTNTASKNGYVYGGSTSGDMAGHITVNGNDVFEVRTTHTGPSKGIVPVAKGDVITLPASGTYYFVPCKNL